MAEYKETPRQKMIAMMYLVLTALLALNVSKEMLDAFVVVNESVELTNENFANKIDDTYLAFNKKYSNDPVKVKPYLDKAQQAKQMSGEMVAYITNLKYELIARTEKIPVDSARISKLGKLKNKDDYDTPTNFFMGDSEDGSKGYGSELKNKIDSYRQNMHELLSADERTMVKLGLKTDGKYEDANGERLNWVQYNFYHTILAADVAILNKIISEVYNAEFDIVNFLLDAVDAKDFKYDVIDAKVLPQKDYVFIGDEYKAEVIVAAYSTTQNPEVFLRMGVDSLPISQLSSARSIEGKGGKVKFTIPASSEGVQKYAGVIRVKSGTGTIQDYFFRNEFTVGRPATTISATKMNVFYIGVDNPVDISVPGVPIDQTRAEISYGTLKRNPQDDSWVVQVAKAPTQGKNLVTISVFMQEGGKTKKMGETVFRLKNVPDPIAKIANQTEGNISKTALKYSSTIVAKMPDDFDFDLTFRVTSFDMVYTRGETVMRETATGGNFTEKMLQYIDNARTGQRVTFEKIIARGPDGTDRHLNPINLTIN
ncbi:MAG: gliding motility protein GldM [Clostridia bacterium]|nr:gliding motility protein GldM [Clostridia bacterium]